jgi:hypothetical protein
MDAHTMIQHDIDHENAIVFAIKHNHEIAILFVNVFTFVLALFFVICCGIIIVTSLP